MAGRQHELTDEEWDLIRDRLPGKASDPGPTADNRLFVNAVLFVARTGVPWRDLPGRFGNWNSVSPTLRPLVRVRHLARAGRRAGRAGPRGTPPRLDEREGAAQRGGLAPPAGRKKVDADARRCLGRSRGGWTSKLHAAVNGAGRLVRLILSPGQAGDAPRASALLAGLRPRHVVADAAYDSDAIRALLRRMRARACIKPNPTRKHKKRYDAARYKHRNVIERFFGSLKRGFRRVATRYEKKAANDLGFAWLAAVLVGIE